jgi:nitrite reductase/ring-hydroxylating ferredoxin subunit
VGQFLKWQPPRRLPRAVPRAARPVTAAARIEHAQLLDRPVSALSDFAVRALPPGAGTDLLHGVPLGRPAHPVLAKIPAACWAAAVLVDRLGGPGRGRTAVLLTAAGVAAAVPAAATGLADWSALHHHQQRVGLVHAAAQAGATVLFAGSVLARAAGRRGGGRVLATAGLVAATAGGYLGGHLMVRLRAGTSHADPVGQLAAAWHDLGPVAELPDGHPVRRQLGGLGLVAVRDGAAVYVLADRCSHLGGPLHQGRVTRGDGAACITCPWHSSTFRLADGAVRRGPAAARQPAFATRVSPAGLLQVRPLACGEASGPRPASGSRGARSPAAPRNSGTGFWPRTPRRSAPR